MITVGCMLYIYVPNNFICYASKGHINVGWGWTALG